jgi:glycosyltransferase involved in cell wall biosynthesis
MASGVPVLAMALGGTRFIASSTEAALLARNEAEFVEFGLELVRDHARRRRMSEAARETAQTRSWSTVFDVVYHAYDAALALTRRETQPLGGARAPIPAKQSA